MRSLKFIVLGLLVSATSVHSQVLECTSAPLSPQPVGKMLKFEDNLFQNQCGYAKNNECRYSEASCERSIGCADIVINGSPNSDEAQVAKMLLVDEIREYASVAVDANIKKMKELDWVREYAAKIGMSIPKTCSSDLLTVHENNSSCDPEILKDLPVVGELDSVRNNFSTENKEKNKLALQVEGCTENLPLGRIYYAKDNAKITQADTDKLVAMLKQHNTECLIKLYSIITGDKSDENKILSDLALHAGSLDYYLKKKVREYMAANCKVVPTIDNICENATKMNLGKRFEIKNLFLPEYVRDTNVAYDSNEKYKEIIDRMKALNPQFTSIDKGIYFRLLEASRCKGNHNYNDKKTCDDVLQVLRNDRAILQASGNVSIITDEQKKEAELFKNLASKNVASSVSQHPYGSAEAFVGPMPQVPSSSTIGTADKKDTTTKNLDEVAGVPNEKASINEAKPTNQTAAPVQNSNSANYNNAYTGVDYNIPGTHPMATDQSGVPIPPPSYPSYINGAQASQQPSQTSQLSATAQETQAIQTKLDETQAKLDKLTAEVAATKAEAEKKKHQDEIDGLKKEIEKLKAEKASAALVSAQPATQLATMPQQLVAPTIAPQSVRQEEYRNTPQAVAPKISVAAKATSGGISVATGSSAILLRQDIIDMPSVDLTNTSSEDPAILKLAMSSVGGKAFPVQDKNKIIWTIVPLVKDGKVISYTAIREKKLADKKEKKPEVARVPASVNIAPVEPAKREIFLKDLNGLMKSKN